MAIVLRGPRKAVRMLEGECDEKEGRFKGNILILVEAEKWGEQWPARAERRGSGVA